MRAVGMDIHRVFAEAVMLDDGRIVRLGRIGMTRDHLEAFARTLTHDDHVVVEATCNAAAVVEVISPHVGRVVVANPRQVRMIAHARIKTDVIDATVLARLYAGNFLPEVWLADPKTLASRRQVTRREQVTRQRVRLKTIAQSILHAHLLPQCPHADLFGVRGRAWLMAQDLPADERAAVERHLREYDRLGEDLRVVERELAREALADADVKRLMTIPGIDMVVAVGLAAAIGPIGRFKRPDQLVAYLGLNPSGTPLGASGAARPARPGLRLQPDPNPPGRATPCRAGGGGLPTTDRGMDEARAAGAHGCRKGGTTMMAARPGFHLPPGSLPRGRPWATGG